jgi:Putative beta-barrel porin 2
MRNLIFCAAVLSLVVLPSRASAQAPPTLPSAAAGSSEAIDDVRKDYRIHAGPFYVKPALLLKELGVDTNVFNEAGEQRSDFTFTVTPQADLAIAMARRGLLKAKLGTDLVYYATYRSQRSVDPQAVIRAEAYAHRLTLFVEGSYLNTRERLNYEIDLRARHQQNDLSGGVAVRFTPKFSVEVARSHGETRFDGDQFFLEQRLQETLNRDTDTWSGVVRHRHSPLTTLGLRYENQRDRFEFSPVRDTDSFRVMPGVEFKPRALISGSAWVGYRSFRPKSPLVPAQSGLVSQLALSYTLLGSTTFGGTYNRDFEFAYETSTPYFVDNSPGLYLRRAIGGKFDVTVNAARHLYEYQQIAVQPADLAATPQRVETTYNYGLTLGYRLKRQTRVGFGVSYWTRDSTVGSIRGYEGLRIGTSVTYGL